MAGSEIEFPKLVKPPVNAITDGWTAPGVPREAAADTADALNAVRSMAFGKCIADEAKIMQKTDNTSYREVARLCDAATENAGIETK